MKKKIVIKVGADCCEKCRGKAMKIAAVADGVVSIAIGGDDNDKLIVIGEGIDAACLTITLKKKLCYANLESIEEVKPPPPPPAVKPPAPAPVPLPCPPPCCHPAKPVPATAPAPAPCPPPCCHPAKPVPAPAPCPPPKPVPAPAPAPAPAPVPPPKPAPVPCPPSWCPPPYYPPPYYQPPCQPHTEFYKVVTDSYGTTPSCIIL